MKESLISNQMYLKVKMTKPIKIKNNLRRTSKIKGLRNNLGNIFEYFFSNQILKFVRIHLATVFPD